MVRLALIDSALCNGMRRMAWPAAVSYQSSASVAPRGTWPRSAKLIVCGPLVTPTSIRGSGSGVGVLVGPGEGCGAVVGACDPNASALGRAAGGGTGSGART